MQSQPHPRPRDPGLVETLARLVGAWPLLFGLALLAGLAGGGMSLLRPVEYTGEIRLSMGWTPDGWPIEPARVVSYRLGSRDHLRRVLAATGLDEETTQLILEEVETDSTVLEEDVVSFKGRSTHREHLKRVLHEASEAVVQEHEQTYMSNVSQFQGRIAGFKGLLEHLKTTENGIPAGTPGLLPDIVELSQAITEMETQITPPRTMPTRLLSGPGVRPATDRPGPLRLAGLAALAGFFLGAIVLVLRDLLAASEANEGA